VETVLLVVASDREMRDLLNGLFSSHGFRVAAAADGASALFQFGLTQPDLVILDMGRPDRDMRQTLRRLRALSSVPIVALSGVDEEAGIDVLRLGADCSVPRPINVRELNARVLALLRRSQGAVLQPAESRAEPS